jgi:hypothetical protein
VIDLRLLEHWLREQYAREVLRRALPSSWRNDPRPKMEDVREFYVEAMLQNKAVRAACPAGAWLEYIELDWIEDDEAIDALLVEVLVAASPSSDETAV